MFDSSVLDVVIGLVFCFASVALLVSAVNEAIASALKLRHKSLLAGIEKLLNDAQGTGLVVRLYNHALISPLAPGQAAHGIADGAARLKREGSLAAWLACLLTSRRGASR